MINFRFTPEEASLIYNILSSNWLITSGNLYPSDYSKIESILTEIRGRVFLNFVELSPLYSELLF